MIAALFARLALGSIFGRLGTTLAQGFGALAGWITRNPLLAIALGFAFVSGILVWRNDRLSEERNQARADQAQAESALKVEQASNKTLTDQIDRQNAAVAALGTASARAVAQGKTALDAALARSADRAAAAGRIVVPVGPVQADCRTPDSVMAVKGKL